MFVCLFVCLFLLICGDFISVFTENPVVTLWPSEGCSGYVRINHRPVCSKHWDNKHSQIVCQELGCGDALYFQREEGLYWPYDGLHVRCHGSESTLGHCETEEGRCDDDMLVTVYCRGECF